MGPTKSDYHYGHDCEWCGARECDCSAFEWDRSTKKTYHFMVAGRDAGGQLTSRIYVAESIDQAIKKFKEMNWTPTAVYKMVATIETVEKINYV